MKPYVHNVVTVFEQVLHPAAGKMEVMKKKRRSSASQTSPKGSPDSQNIRDLFKRQDSFRRNPAP